MRPFGGGQTKVPALSPNALPNLESLSIPALLLNSCMRGTVRKLSLLGAERDYDGPEADVGLGPGEGFLYPALPLLAPEKILALTKSNDVTEVHLPQHLFFEFPLHKYFPRLEVLLLSWCPPNFPVFMPGLRTLTSTHPIHKTILTPLCKQWPAGSFARLRELRLQFVDNLESKIQGETVNWELNAERVLIEEHISSVFPQLLLFTRVPVFVWDREFLGAPWRAFMPHEYEDMTGREAGYQDI